MEREFEYEREKPVKKGGALGKILMMLLGILLGIVITVGSVVGVGFWLYNEPLETPVNMADSYISDGIYDLVFGELQEDGTRKEGLIHPNYANEKVDKLLDDFSDVMDKLSDKTGTVESLCNISPIVESYLDNLLEEAEELTIKIDKKEVMTTPVESLSSYLKDCMLDASIGDLLTAMDEELDPMLLALCYGEEHVHFEYNEDGDVVMLGNEKKTTFNDLINGKDEVFGKVPVASIIDVKKDDDTMLAIAYGSSNRYKFVGDEVVMLQVRYTVDVENGVIYDDKDTALEVIGYEIVGNNDVAKLTFKDGSVEYLKQDVGNVALAFADEACTTPINYKKTMVNDLQQDSEAIIDNVYLKDALGVDANSHNVLISLAYGEYGENYEIVNNKINLLNNSNPRTIGALRLKGGDLINEIPLSDILSDDKTALTRYLLYGREGVHFKEDLATGEIKMLQKRIAILNNAIYNEYGESISDYVFDTTKPQSLLDEDGNVYQYIDAGLGTVKTDDGDAKLYYLFDAAGKEVKYKKTSLGDMTGSNNLIGNLTGRLTVSEVMDKKEIESNKFLKHVKDTVIDDLPNAIDNLTIKQVFEDEIFQTNDKQEFLDKNGNVTTDPNEYVVKGEWWYMLHNEEDCTQAGHDDPATCNCISDYNVKDMNKMIDNMKNNMHISTLQKLADDGMLTFGPGMLNSAVITDVKVYDSNGTFHTYDVLVRIPDSNGGWKEDVPAKDAFVDSHGNTKASIGLLTVEETIEYAEGLINILNTINAMNGTTTP